MCVVSGVDECVCVVGGWMSVCVWWVGWMSILWSYRILHRLH